MEMIMNHGFGRGQTWPFGKKTGNKIQGEEVLEDLSKSFSDGKWVELAPSRAVECKDQIDRPKVKGSKNAVYMDMVWVTSHES